MNNASGLPPRVSVVLPNYNHARYLPRALEAILAQSVPAHEVIVIDDASTDDSVQVIERFAAGNPVIRFYRNERNQGVVYGMNRGVELATGDYVYFAAADDQVLPGLFEKSLRLLSQHRDAGLCCTIGDWREVSSGLNWHVGVGMADAPCYLSPERLVELERSSRLFIASHTAIMRRDAVIEAGKFRPELKMHCDWFVMYVIAFRYGICFVPEPLGISNIHPASFYKAGVKQRQEYQQVLERMLELLSGNEYQESAELIRRSGALFLFGKPMLKLLLKKRDYRRFLTIPFLRKNLWHTFKLQMKGIMPAAAANLYFRLSGYRAKRVDPESAARR